MSFRFGSSPLSSSLLLIVASILLILLVIQTIPTRPSALAIPNYLVPATAALSQSAPIFRDTSLDWGVAAAHQQTDEQLSALTETLGAGVCAFDANKDGWVDLFYVGGSGHTRHYGRKSWWHQENGNHLLLNKNGQYFSDVTEQAGLGNPNWGMGCAVADLDNNGWPDLIVTGVGSTRVFSNTGDAVFVDVTEASGIVAEHWSTGASLADYNNDSLVDVYISNYVDFNKGAKTYERNKGFVTDSVSFDATLYDPLPNKLYLNEGGFRFRDTTASAGVADARGRSLGAHWTDLNDDGWQDLIVINDVDSPNQVYINEGGSRFVPSESDYALIETPESHDLLEDDFDNDSVSELLITRNRGIAPIFAVRATDGTEKYSDQAWASGIADRRDLNNVSWGAASGDFNNDGHLDLYIANGDFKPDIDSPFVTQAQHNQVLWGLGNGTFVHDTALLDSSYPLSSRSVITADLNNDGKLEIVVTNNNDPLQIFENISEHEQHWVGLDLFGTNTFTQASGAQIAVKTGGNVLHRTALTKQGFLASGDNRVHIGLGNNADPIDVNINWPDGTQSFFGALGTDVYYSVNRTDNSITPIRAIAEHTGQFNPAFDGYDDSTRVKLGELLLDMGNTESNKHFSRLWSSSNDSVKKTLLYAFSQNWDPRYFAYVKDALDSGSESLQIQAIMQLKTLEFEYSIPWLIPLLNHESERVSCASANTLRFFFEQEEAVTHRKYLSVAPLVRMLKTGSDNAAVCAADALAAAESKRAVLPLIAQSQMRSAEAVKVASIRALGLIRDNHAASLFIDIVEDPQPHHPAVIAEALISLVRLGDTNIQTYLDTIFNLDSNHTKVNTLLQLRIANSLIANDETIVFPKKYLFEKITSLLDRELSSTTATAKDNSSAHDELTIEILVTLRLAQMHEYQFFVEQQTRDHNPDIRKSAYQTLFALDTNWQKTFLPELLENESGALILDVLNSTGQAGGVLNPEMLKKLGARLDFQGPMAAELAPMLESLRVARARELLRSHFYQDLSEVDVRKILDLCDAHGTAISSALSTHDVQKSPSLEYVYLYCHFSDTAPRKLQSSEKLADRLLLKQVVESSRYTAIEKQQLIIRAAANDRVTAETLLLAAVPSYTGDALLQAISVLSRHQLTNNMSSFLWGLLRDVNAPPVIRFEAAKILLPMETTTVSEYLNSEFLTNATI